MKTTYKGLTIRGDSLYCPLAFGLDTYYDCNWNCTYCYCRGLNHTWGKGEQRGLDLNWFERELTKPRPNPRTPLGWAIKNKKTMRFGNKSEPFQPIEKKHRISRDALQILKDLDWNVKVESRGTDLMLEYSDLLISMDAIITTTVTAGLDKDYKLFEPKSIPSPADRLGALRYFQEKGLQVALTTEPFIPGYHTLKDWKNLLDAMEQNCLDRVNLYNLHFSPFVAKRLAEVPGLDIEKVWTYNDAESVWKAILKELIQEAECRGFTVGCPDFINSGNHVEGANTCCAVDVKNPCRFNLINWKTIHQKTGKFTDHDFLKSWDGVGDLEEGRKAWKDKSTKNFTFQDAVKTKGKGFF